jgi:hypothetical protein
MKICAACQAINSQESNFCSLCRAPFERPSRSAYCLKGHAMHPSWPECLECKGERNQAQDFGSVPPRMPTIMETGTPSSHRGATVIENFVETQPIAIPIPPPSPTPPSAPTPPRGAARPGSTQVITEGSSRTTAPFEPSPPAVSRHVTQYAGMSGTRAQPARGAPASPRVVSPGAGSPELRPGRRIVGLLLTYTWRPEGQIFALREGRNLIGRNPECDIAIPDDPHLSETNSHITYRKNFVLGDLVSMSGTDLNGVPVEDSFVKLANYAQIRAGSTHFTFITAEPPAAGKPSKQD